MSVFLLASIPAVRVRHEQNRRLSTGRRAERHALPEIQYVLRVSRSLSSSYCFHESLLPQVGADASTKLYFVFSRMFRFETPGLRESIVRTVNGDAGVPRNNLPRSKKAMA